MAGEFYVYRCLKKYTVFLTTREPVVAYGVLSLTDPLEELIGHRLPHLCKAVLLPFKGRIVYDGMLAGYNVHFGGGIRRRLKESYDDAKRRMGIITSLPPPAVGHESTGERLTPRRQASKSKGNAKGAKPTTSEAARLAHDEIVGIIDAFCREYPRRRVCDLVPEAGGHPGPQAPLPADPRQARVVGERDRAGRSAGSTSSATPASRTT